MWRWLKVFFPTLGLAVALAALSIVASSCGNNSATKVRFVDAIQDGAAMDIEVNGAKEFTNIAFLGVEPVQPGYDNLPSGSVTVEGFLTGTTTVGFNSTKVSWNGGGKYTVVATGLVANGKNATILSLQDDSTAPAGNDFAFRVVNASPSGPSAVDVYMLLNPATGPTSAAPAISALAYTQASSYISVAQNPNSATTAPGYTVFITPTGSKTPIFSEGFSPLAGAVRTLVLTDVQNGHSMNSSFLELSDAN